ncbi:LacI family DNA-binding transcriptional regulator [Halomonas sp. JS92-SW72]|uniref:LacI family DNA-binding transcriptional regulator n=1 Tax=Halomonas sp. JS92-SW72 TaxID=2306583 RepID=UPI000E5ADB5F|nr:LacI family DNA-binding transcriptional regulator [Halomonas sp. JS92-SW72]
MNPSLRSTILDVSRAAGASKTSVSRYFGSERQRLGELQQRIAEAARHLGYQPNKLARSLKGGGSRLIGMLVADLHAVPTHRLHRPRRHAGPVG